MNKIKYLLAVTFLFSCSNRVIVQRAIQDEDLSGRLFYVLPANTLDFEIRIKEETYTPGEFLKTNAKTCEDAYIRIGVELLGLDATALKGLIKNNLYTKYSIMNDQINWSQGAVPDTSKVFVFKNKPAFYKDNILTLAYNSDWLVSTGTISTDNKSAEIVTTFVSTALSAASALAKSGSLNKATTKLTKGCNEKLDRIVALQADYEKFQLAPPPNLNPDALQIAKNIRLKLIEKEIERLFYIKKETIKVLKLSFYVSDVFKTANVLPLFKLDDKGILNVNSNIYKDLLWPKGSKAIVSADYNPAASLSYYSLTAASDSRGLLERYGDSSFRNRNPNETHGLAYNIPLNIWFYLKDGDDNILKFSRYSIAQFGYVNTLDSRLNKADFTLDSLTGRLVKATLESKAWISSDRVKNGGALLPQADSVFRKKAKPTAIEILQDEVKEKELRVKLKELDSKLN